MWIAINKQKGKKLVNNTVVLFHVSISYNLFEFETVFLQI